MTQPHSATRRAAHPAPRRKRRVAFLKNMFYQHPGHLNMGIVVTLLVILAFGLVMLFSASYASGYYRKNNSFYYINPQVKYAVLGLIVMYVASRVDYHWLRRWVWGLYAVTLVLLIVVLFMEPINNHKRWINIEGLPTLQVSEIAKFSMVLALAHMMELYRDKMSTFNYGVLMPICIAMPFWIAILPETHYSAIMLLGCMLLTMMWVGGTKVGWFFLGIAGMASAAAIVLLTGRSYVKDRFAGWLDPFSDVFDTTRQTAQSLYAVGSGGLFGLGIGNSRQKHLWLPEATNDFIFSILCEELGFVGAALCIGLFMVLIVQGVGVAMKAPDRFGALIAVGIVAQISWQVFFNIAVVTNSMPNTGISLPFFSYGGTSLLMLLGEMGVLLSICRAGNVPKEEKAAPMTRTAEPAAPVQES